MIGGLAILLLCQLTGEATARLLGLPVPGPVLGMALLFGVLLARGGEVPKSLADTADALLRVLGLLFVPAGVGVMLHLPEIARDWAPIALAILAGTLLTVGVTGLLAQRLLRGKG
jgi:holin-like protein